MRHHEKLTVLGINLNGKTSGQIKVKCPQCSHLRTKNRSEPCLSVNIDEGVYHCHHCEWKGSVGVKKYAIPEQLPFKEATRDSRVLEYFEKERNISRNVVSRFIITLEEQYIPAEQQSVPCITFNYFFKDVLVNKKYRSFSKNFTLVKDAELIFYNLNSIEGEKEVIITEGEIDCMSFAEAGITNCISVPNGANKNLSYLSSAEHLFADVEKFYIAADADEKGQELLEELSRRLGRDRCWKVVYPDDCKDANEVLVKYGETKVKELLKNAQPFPIEGVVTANETLQGLLSLYKNGSERGIELPELGQQFTELITFKRSMLYVWTGIPSHGKSSVVEYIEALLAVKEGYKWAIFSPEHYPLEYLVYRYAELIVGKPFFRGHDKRMTLTELHNAVNFINEHFFFIRPVGDSFALDEILNTTKSLILRHGCTGLTIDPWNTIDHNYEGDSETKYIEKSLNKLTIFKQKYDLLINLIAHPNKMRKREDGQYEVPNLYDISGSANFFNKCDFGITVYRDFRSGCTDIYIQKAKFKNLGKAGYTTLSYIIENCRYVQAATPYQTSSLITPPEMQQTSLEEDSPF
jgi:twinkle protein